MKTVNFRESSKTASNDAIVPNVLSDSISKAMRSGETAHFKAYPAYCTLKAMMCLKEITEDPGNTQRLIQQRTAPLGNSIFESHNGYAQGFIAASLPNISDINSIDQKYRHRVERKIRRQDLASVDDLYGAFSPQKLMHLKTAAAFSETFDHDGSHQRFLKRLKVNAMKVASEVHLSGSLSDTTLRQISFGSKEMSSPKIAEALGSNPLVGHMTSRIVDAYDAHVDQLRKESLQEPATPEEDAAHEAVKQSGKISIWKRMKSALGEARASVGNVIKASAAVMAISLAGMGSQGLMNDNHSIHTYNVTPVAQTSVTSQGVASVEARLIGETQVATAEPTNLMEEVYVVQEGDTAWDIAKTHLSSLSSESPSDNQVASLLKETGYDKEDLIHPGQTLTLPIRLAQDEGIQVALNR